MGENYIYVPENSVQKEFKCMVPMEGVVQQFFIDKAMGKSEGGDYGFKTIGEDSYSLDIPARKMEEKILQLIEIRADKTLPALNRTLDIHVGEGAVAKVLLCTHTMVFEEFLTEETINVTLEPGAMLDLVFMQNEHNKATHRTRTSLIQKGDSKLNMSIISLHGGLIENRISADLTEEHAECMLSGLYLLDRSQRFATDVFLRHSVPNCTSDQIFKGILDDQARADFSGLIYVAQDAQKTSAMQANHNLVISDDAKINTKPHLEIYADDVKCSHGATIGRMDEDSLFYLRSRGIDKKEATILQQLAFVHEVLARVKNPALIERLSSLVERRLRGEFSDCPDCSNNCC